MQSLQEKKISEIIADSISAMGYELVRIKLSNGNKSAKLQIMAERMDNKNMNVDDCANISRNISTLLDVEDPISGNYELEVSSPGIDRPLMKPEDFKICIGDVAKVTCKIPLLENTRKVRGVIKDVGNASVFLEAEDGNSWQIEFDNIDEAKLVLTDKLIKKHLKKEEEKQNG